MTSAGKRRRKWIGWLVVAALASVYAMAGPYVFPVSWGLGACLKDWTSPSSYLPRVSPLKTVDGILGRAAIRICYGAPAARGRTLFGQDALVPYGEYWRTGANEPTRLFINAPIRLGSLFVPPGRYSVYTIPGPESWEVIVNRSTFQWGYDFSEGVLAQELGRITVPSRVAPKFVEVFTIEWLSTPAAELVLTWGDVRFAIPVAEAT